MGSRIPWIRAEIQPEKERSKFMRLKYNFSYINRVDMLSCYQEDRKYHVQQWS